MPIPDYQRLISPLLRFLGDGKEHTVREAVEALADQFKLSPEERKEMLPGGEMTIMRDRVLWAMISNKNAGLLTGNRRGPIKITARGQEILSSKPTIGTEVRKRLRVWGIVIFVAALFGMSILMVVTTKSRESAAEKTPPHSQKNQQTQPGLTGRWLHDLWQGGKAFIINPDFETPDGLAAFPAGAFEGFVTGVVQEAVEESVLKEPFPGVTFAQIDKTVGFYLEKHPEYWDRPACELVIEAIKKQWPEEKVQPKV
jgi:hypothetical protein